MKFNKFGALGYKFFYPSVKKINRKIIVSRSGGVFFDWKFSFLCVYRNPIVFIKVYLISVISLLTRSLDKKDEDRKIYGIIHSIWTAGYYHWVTESLPRALVLKDFYPNYIPLLPSDRYSNYSDSLKLLGLERVDFFPKCSNVILSSSVVSECPPAFGTTDPTLLIRVKRLLYENIGISEDPNPQKIVYVSRLKARGRRIIDEENLLNALGRENLEVICFEDFSFADQIRIMSNTKCLISIHGAALTNMLFMPPGGVVIEILPEKHGIFDYNYVRNSFKHDPCYVRLAGALHHKYFPIFGQADTPFYRSTHMSNVKLDKSAYLKIISLINDDISIQKNC